MSPIKGGVCKTLTETMRRRASALLSIAFLSVFLFVSFSVYYSRNPISISEVLYPTTGSLAVRPNNAGDGGGGYNSNRVIQEELNNNNNNNHRSRRVSSVQDSSFINSVSVLLPDWQVLLIVSPDMDSQMLFGQNLTCLYPSNSTAPAKFSGFLQSLNQITFKCFLPKGARRRYPFLAPILTRLPVVEEEEESVSHWRNSPPVEMLRWNYLVYESFSTENDVVLFAKGLNNRQGINKSPHEFKCVFIDETNNNNTVITAVTSSTQEVFRCNHPDLTAVGFQDDDDYSIKLIKVSLQILEEKRVVPSVAYYNPLSKIATKDPKFQLCASTMIYNVGKFLREWIIYHSKIGVEKFILYDNDSDDDFISVVKDLNHEGYNIETVLWLWPKTQESGFSHAALYANKSCNWMMYVDVDEFVFSPSWENSSKPSDQMLKSLLPSYDDDMIGEVSIMCNEFGPSNQRSNPIEGVTQGYNCRRKLQNRHKSIILLQAIDNSLLNVIHHFTLKENYGWNHLSLEEAAVNHYKYQAWSEFKAKFRRRVSAYVVDWMKEMNPLSKDRTPGLGFEAKEPPGWENKFCEVRDDRLKLLMQRWFGLQTDTDHYRMVWQT